MPSFNILEEYARRVEDEMSASARKDAAAPKTKRCPTCSAESPLSATFCDVCGTEFPKPGARFKPCPECAALNPMTAATCQECGASFATSFTLTLEEALRTGAIVRGMDVDEVDVQASEAMAPSFRRKLLNSGDAKM